MRDVFCGPTPPDIRSLVDLERALLVGPAGPAGISGTALAGHSTSLSARSVSAINPRVIMYRMDISKTRLAAGIHPEAVALSFNRGDQIAELVTLDRKAGEFSFYLLRFEQPCNHAPQGCRPGDLLTEAAETDWQNLSLYDEPLLANTVVDCAPCHQPGGPDTPKLLRMHEFDSPWTHWFFDVTEGGKALLDDYTAAKGDESVGGLTYEQIAASSPGGLQLFVSARHHDKSNMFHSEIIEREVRDSAALQGGNQPFDNAVAGHSPTWRMAFERAQRGESIPVPYHDVKVTDPAKLARMTAAYQAYRAGTLERSALPDLRDVLPDDPQRLAAMGLMTEPGLTGEQVLMSACGMCHNDRLDPKLSRARFRADLVGVSRAEKDAAIARLMLPSHSPYAMPPARLRTLSDEARALAIEALRR